MYRLPLTSLLLAATLCFSACLPVPVPSKDHPGAEASLAERYLDRFPAREMCATSFPYRWWCPLAAGAVPRLDLPSQATSYVGLTAWVADGDRVQDALGRQTGLTVLHIDASGAALVVLKSDDAEERRAMSRAYVDAAMALGGRGDEVTLTPELAEYVTSQRGAMARHPLTRKGPVATWQSDLDSYIWEARDGGWGRVLVVVEEAKGGMFVSLFPEVGVTVQALAEQDSADDTPERRAARSFAPPPGHRAEVAQRHRTVGSGAQKAHASGGARAHKPAASAKKSHKPNHKRR